MIYQPTDIQEFMKKAQYWASSFPTLCIFDSNGFEDPYSAFSMMIAVGKKKSFTSKGRNTYEDLQKFIDQNPHKYIIGYLSYELKNEPLHGSPSLSLGIENGSIHGFSHSFFYIPEVILKLNSNEVEIIADAPSAILDYILKTEYRKDENKPSKESIFKGEIKQKMSREEYGLAFQKIQQHILQGDIYEVNLCQEFYAEHASLLPFEAYKQLNQLSPNPFSCFFKDEGQYIISASPERFLARRGNRLISQPIKGTTAKGNTPEEERKNKERLKNSSKDIHENIMIVDLVRNDLTKSAEKGTVKVDELVGLYTFPHVHQLISTISCTQAKGITESEIIENTFPPGSMTGAPKLSAMRISEKTESSPRGVYSGSIGYLSPSNDFDFNVIIRSIVYNEKQKYLSYHVGGAITALSVEEDEYQECLLKAQAIVKLLTQKGSL